MNHEKIYILKSTRGGKKLLYNGYLSNFHKTLNNINYWRCCDRRCNGWLQTVNFETLKKEKAHSLEHKNYEKTKLFIKKSKIVNRALNTNEKSGDIIISNMGISNPLIEKENIKYKSLVDFICRKRKKHNVNIVKDDIPENIKHTFANESF
ncbi:hypothetical protein DMUE_4340, partial [Dictyocoela muelleri]